MADKPKSAAPNQGEGDYASARKFDADERDFVQSGKVEGAAKAAKAAVDGPEGAELERARKQTAAGRPRR